VYRVVLCASLMLLGLFRLAGLAASCGAVELAVLHSTAAHYYAVFTA